ncbi:MAG: amidohydrolase [Thaumarchaeota archaeon]|nr:amidohydrolase [Nitrososphaerota archaeon]
MQSDRAADTVIFNGRIATQDSRRSFATAVAVKNGRFIAVGDNSEALDYKGPETKIIDVKGRTVVPGLSDSHTHFIREGLNYNLELRWDGLRSLAEAMRRFREQAQRTPASQWVRVIGGWSEFHFEERRVPSPEELTLAAPSTPAFITHYYHDAILNRAALEAIGYGKDTPAPIGGEIQRDGEGNPTGLLIARSNALIIYSNLAKAPKLGYADQVNSTLQYMRELNRLGLTSVIDGGGGSQFYPQDYSVIGELARNGQLTVRTAYNLMPQRAGHELEDFELWSKMTKPGEGDDFYRMNGAGESLVASAADFENFMEPRPVLPPTMEKELGDVASLLVKNRWPFQLHATYDESISRFLDVFEEVNDKTPFAGLRWFFVHAETISDRNIERVRKLGGGIGVQDRMAFQGEHFMERYGEEMTRRSPPVARMIEMGIPVGGGSDATRVSRYDPWVVIYWLVTGKTVGGTQLYPSANRLSRMEALRLITANNAWFSNEESKKGSIEVGKLADLAVLSLDYFEVPEEEIKDIESMLTVVGGKAVYAAGEFSNLSLPSVPVSPAWSPVAWFKG